MNSIYLNSVKILDGRIALAVSHAKVGEAAGNVVFPTENGLRQHAVLISDIALSVMGYITPESRYYRDGTMIDTILAFCLADEKAINDDGTTNDTISNFHQPDLFIMPTTCNAYRYWHAIPDKTEREKEVDERIYHLVKRLSAGLLESGFHTPNHRWVLTAALYCAYNTLKDEDKDERMLERARKFLAEKIDIDENGEYSERSVGMYSAITDRALCLIASEAGMPELYAHVKKNLQLVWKFIERDSLIFTQNSRRVDKGEVGSDLTFDFERYADICEMAYCETHDEFFLQMLIHVMNRRRAPFRFPMTIQLAIKYPELKDLDITEKPVPELPESFHTYYPASRIVRARESGVTFSLLGNHPSFLNVTVGDYTMSVRLCSSFFAIAQFTGETMEEVAPGQYRMTFHATADYKLPFDEAPEGSEDYWSMDYQSRESIARCDYFYTVDVTFRPNGIVLHVKADGTDTVPMKLEFFFTPGLHVRAGDAMTVGSAGGFLCARDGDVVLSAPSGEAFTLRGAFAKHFYHRDMRGSQPVPKNKFAVYMTDFSPAEHTVEILCETARPWDFFD